MHNPAPELVDRSLSKQADLFQKCRSFAPMIDFREDEIETSVVARFEKQVERYADQLAVKSKDESLTYQALNQAANQLGGAIISQIGEGEEPVAYMLPHGAEQIIAMLGIVKAGKMYLPLDPSFPRHRLAGMLSDAHARLIVTGKDNLEQVAEITQKKIPLLEIDKIRSAFPADNLNLRIEPDRLISLLYTSGTSGQPKGVVSKHRNLMHGMWSYTHHFGFCFRDRMALLLSTSFAASVSTVFGALLSGATLLPFDIQRGLHSLKDWLLEEQITILMIVPTLFRHFAMSLNGEEKFPHLRLVSVGGEPVLHSDVALFKQNFSSECIFRNNLSGTEMGNLCNYLIDMSTEVTDNVVPVGYTLGEKQVRLVDEAGNAVQFGEVGEIVVQSHYLSPGYWHKPELTKEKFQEVADGSGRRQYFTGDLGRMSPDGCLTHLGRKDFLVKIRGYRIELGEIEGVLTQHPAIQESIVVVQESKGSEKKLVAYIVSDSTVASVTDEELRIFLKKRLPSYMIPFAFVRLPEFPLTPTGKIDRLALPSLEKALNLEQDYVPPRDEIESQLVQVWEELLEISPVGIRSDFFLIGGHSLLAARMIARVEEVFGRRLDFASLSQAATIEHLAEILRKDEGIAVTTSLVPIRAKGERIPLFCVHGVGGHILPFLQLASHLDSEQPVYGLQAKPVEKELDEERTIEGMASQYIAEIERIQATGPYYLAGFSFGGFLAYEMARQLMEKEKKVAVLAIFDSQVRGLPGYRRALTVTAYAHYLAKSYLEKMKFRLKFTRQQPETMVFIDGEKQNLHPINHNEFILGDVAEEEVPDYLKAVMQANLRALLRYVPKSYSGKLTLFKSLSHGQGVHYGWGELVRGGVEDYYVPGSHRGIMQEPNVAILAERLQKCIDKALES